MSGRASGGREATTTGTAMAASTPSTSASSSSSSTASASSSTSTTSSSSFSSLSQRRAAGSVLSNKAADIRIHVDKHTTPSTATGAAASVHNSPPDLSSLSLVHSAPHSPIDHPEKDEPSISSHEALSAREKGALQPPPKSLTPQHTKSASAPSLPAMPSPPPPPPPSQPLLALTLMQGQAAALSTGFPSFSYASPSSSTSSASVGSISSIPPPPGLPSPTSGHAPSSSSSASSSVSSPTSATAVAQSTSTPGSTSSASTSPSSPSPPDGTTIVIKYLPNNASIESLSSLCSPYGAVTQIRLKKDPNTGASLGYAFVHFDSPSAAVAAAVALDGLQMGNKVIRVQMAKSPKAAQAPGAGAGAAGRGVVLVTGLPRWWTSQHVQGLLEVYGHVAEVTMGEVKAGEQSRPSASVRFSDPASTVPAMAALNGAVLQGATEALSVRLAHTHERSSSGTSTASLSSSASSAASTPAQRSRRASAFGEQLTSSSSPLGAVSASPFGYTSFEQGQPPSGQGHVQAIPGGYAVFPAASYGQDLLSGAGQQQTTSHAPFFSSAESFTGSSAGAGGSLSAGFSADAFYGYPFYSPHSSSQSPLSSGQSTPTSYLAAYPTDPTAFYYHSALMHQQQQQQQHSSSSPHGLHHSRPITNAPASSPASASPSMYPQHSPMMPAPYDDTAHHPHQHHAPFHSSPYSQPLPPHASHPLLLPNLLLSNPLASLSYPPLHLSSVPISHTLPHPSPSPSSSHHPHTSSSSSHSHSHYHRPPLERPGICLFVFHLPPDLSDSTLHALFAPFGPVLSCKVITNPQTGASKGYGFVNFATMEAARAAIGGLNGFKLGTKFLKVQFKKSKQDTGG